MQGVNFWDETAKIVISHQISQHVLDRTSPNFQLDATHSNALCITANLRQFYTYHSVARPCLHCRMSH